MSWKLVVGLIILAVTGLAAWKAHLYMDARAIAVLGSEGWVIQGKGWAILWELLPPTLLITLVGGLAGTAAIVTIYGHAALADENERVKQAEQAQAEAERERDQAFASEGKAQEIANRKVSQKHATLEQFKRELWQKEQELLAREAEASELKDRAIAALRRAEAIEVQAKRRQENASAAFNRKKRKLEKLRG